MVALTSFGGIIPRTSWHLLPDNAATVAHDVKLRNGKVQAWREKLPLSLAPDGSATLYYAGCCPLTWENCVAVTDYVADYGRYFITGRADRPECFTVSENCATKYFYLGVPAPTSPLWISALHRDGRECAQRRYMYTYVNIFGEESAPSPVSAELTVADNAPVYISIPSATLDAGYAIKSLRIYRTATAAQKENVKEQEAMTDFLFVAELDISQLGGVYADTKLERELGWANNTRETRLPPEDLRHIAHIKGTGVLTGVTSNQVHFSKNFQPYNWPAEYDMTLPHNIVNMVVVDSKVIVSTDSFPYVIEGAPSCEARKCRSATDVDIPLPDISCGHAHSAAATPFGMLYSSKDGLVLVSPDGQFQIITSGWFSTDDWIKIRPDTVRLTYWRGYIICTTDVITFMLEIDGKTYNDFQLGALTTISEKPVDMIVTASGELMFLEDNLLISQWNAGKKLRPYKWESREFTFGGRGAPTSAKVRTNQTLFKLLSPHADLAYERMVVDEVPFRLRRLGRNMQYRVGLYGTGDVDFVMVGAQERRLNVGR